MWIARVGNHPIRVGVRVEVVGLAWKEVGSQCVSFEESMRPTMRDVARKLRQLTTGTLEAELPSSATMDLSMPTPKISSAEPHNLEIKLQSRDSNGDKKINGSVGFDEIVP